MDKTINKVLTVCIKKAREGETDINVFDLMYETSLPYPELKNKLDELISENEISQSDIKTYKFIGDINRKFKEAEDEKYDLPKSDKSSRENDPLSDKRAYLERRRQEILERMRNEQEQSDDAPLFVADSSVGDKMDEDELRYKALKLCIERGQVSVSMLQRAFPIGYLHSCKLVDWMEDMGYVSKAEGSKPRQILISLNEFNETFEEPVSYFEEEDEELDEKFVEYEKYLRQQLTDEGRQDEIEATQMEKLSEFMKDLLREESIILPWEEIPEHPSWCDENDFMRVCAEKLMGIVNTNKKSGRQGALKKARALLEKMRQSKDRAMIEVYECIVFELKNISNYYYIKIREGLL